MLVGQEDQQGHNPIKDNFKINTFISNNTDLKYQLMNNLGSVLMTENIALAAQTLQSFEINTQNLASGLYLLKTQLGKEIKIFKLIKE